MKGDGKIEDKECVETVGVGREVEDGEEDGEVSLKGW